MERSIVTCKEMLFERGYEVYNEIPISEDETMYKIMAKKSGYNDILVFFLDKIKFNIKCIGNIFVELHKLDFKHAIIVYKKSITSQTNKTIEQNQNFEFELFNEDDLQINITKHFLQPKFSLLNETETTKFKAKFGVKIPIMRLNDPIARFYNYKKGNIVQITRKNGYVSYRIVC